MRILWVDTIKMHLREVGWVGVDSIDLAEDRNHWSALGNTVESPGSLNLW
jgi:hypothetical protein